MTGGRFVGSDRVVLSGSSNRSTPIELVSVESEFSSGNKIEIRGTCSAMEVGSVTRYSKSFVAVGTNIEGRGALSVVEIQSDGTDVWISPDDGFYQITEKEDSVYTSLAYYGQYSQLAASNECGDVIVRDLTSASEVVRFNAEFCGVDIVKYSNSGHILSLGPSNSAQLKVWDIRTGSPAMVRSSTRPTESTVARLTSVLTSYVNDYDILCGTSAGRIVQWDTRRDGYISHEIHASNSSVTALCAHPFIEGAVLSGASDGTVACMEFDVLGGGRGRRRPGRDSVGKAVIEVNQRLLQEPSAITSIDADISSKKILVTSKLGRARVLTA
eukprot:CAMPEP_0185037502 /NCGR_PEP_ID=MMETSP1103-20130426/32012_1 /TAXON_ID=36769 /ORGANISM="Paraphysomonas bandaiensis, Strain Caron Lab Isolate" /LENGTH=327 /DNA_ID=CAMNT_0027575501 /DNA_START=21 /DNA_END=1001 /DNA_ORIENTATION=-